MSGNQNVLLGNLDLIRVARRVTRFQNECETLAKKEEKNIVIKMVGLVALVGTNFFQEFILM